VNRVTAVLHATGGTTAGEPCSVAFVGESLVIEAQRTLTLPASELSASMGGFGDDTLFIHATHGGNVISVAVSDAAAQRMLVQDAPAGFARALGRSHRAVNYHRRKWNTVLGTLGGVALTAVIVWWQSEAIVAWAADRVPQAREEQIGRLLLNDVQAEGGLRESGAALDAVKKIGTQLTQGSRYKYQWLVKESSEVNAFAGPGGVVVVNTGLIAKADTPEELAGVLAHEVQHVEHRHTLRSMIHSAGWAAVLAVALGDVSAITGVFIHQAGNLHHSRKLEAEADADAVVALAREGISPAGMESLFVKLQQEQKAKGEDFSIALLSSHPATADRLAAVAALVKATPCECKPMDMDWAAVKADAVRRTDAEVTGPDVAGQ
jgi:beta-barrel assembly-enhancing protease